MRTKRRGRPRARRNKKSRRGTSGLSIGATTFVNILSSVFERKFFDSLFASSAMTPAGNFFILDNVSQGTTPSSRAGALLRILQINVDLNFWIGGVSTLTYMRAIVVYDKQANGSVFAATDIFQAAPSTNDYTQAQYNAGNANRFMILLDKQQILDTIQTNVLRVDKVIKTQLDVKYNTGNAGTVADIDTGSVYLVLFCNQTINQSVATGSIRVIYSDA
jgi:hypothetical protein